MEASGLGRTFRTAPLQSDRICIFRWFPGHGLRSADGTHRPQQEDSPLVEAAADSYRNHGSYWRTDIRQMEGRAGVRA